MNYRNIYRWLTFPLLFTVVGLLLVGAVCPPAPRATIIVVPAIPTVATGQPFSVYIRVNPTTEIAGAQCNLYFDPSMVTAISVTEGDLLNQGGCNTFFLPGTIDNDAGVISGIACAITTPDGTVSTLGMLARIDFTAGTTAGDTFMSTSYIIVGNSAGQQLVPLKSIQGMVTVIDE